MPDDWSKVTEGSKVSDSRITPGSMSGFVLRLLRYCEDPLSPHTRVYLVVIHHISVTATDTHMYILVCCLKTFSLSLVKSVALESHLCLNRVRKGCCCLITQKLGILSAFRRQGAVTFGCVCPIHSVSVPHVQSSGLVFFAHPL